MSFTYEDIQKTLIEKEVYADESYIVRALKTFGFDEFPKAGLTDYGANQLIKKVTDIQEGEANLILKRERKTLRKKKGIEEISIEEEPKQKKSEIVYDGIHPIGIEEKKYDIPIKRKKLPLAIRIPKAGLEGIITLSGVLGDIGVYGGLSATIPSMIIGGVLNKLTKTSNFEFLYYTFFAVPIGLIMGGLSSTCEKILERINY